MGTLDKAAMGHVNVLRHDIALQEILEESNVVPSFFEPLLQVVVLFQFFNLQQVWVVRLRPSAADEH